MSTPKIFDNLIDGLKDLSTLTVKTYVGKFDVVEPGIDGGTRFNLVPDPNCKKIVSMINLIDGDIQTGMDEDFLSAPYEQMRGYHAQREAQAHEIIAKNVAVIKELVGLAVSYMKSRDELPDEGELSGGATPAPAPTPTPTPDK